jgi:hypothetical protein
MDKYMFKHSRFEAIVSETAKPVTITGHAENQAALACYSKANLRNM